MSTVINFNSFIISWTNEWFVVWENLLFVQTLDFTYIWSVKFIMKWKFKKYIFNFVIIHTAKERLQKYQATGGFVL